MRNRIPCGGFNLDQNFLGMNENNELSLTGGGEGDKFKQLVTDGEGKVKWEDRLAYEEMVWKDFVLSNQSKLIIDGFTMPAVEETVTVKVNGVESVETVKAGEFNGFSYSYIGTASLEIIMSGSDGWCVVSIENDVVGYANPQTTVSLHVTELQKLDNKFIDTSRFVEMFDPYNNGNLLKQKTYYKESGDSIKAFIFSDLIRPKLGQVFVSTFNSLSLVQVNSIGRGGAFFISGFGEASNSNDGLLISVQYIFGKSEEGVAEVAANSGYTLTTKPTT